MKKSVSLGIIIALTTLAPALACEALPDVGPNPQVQALKSLHSCFAWVRLTPAAVPVAAAYIHLHNLSEYGDVLKSVSSPIADTVELHETKITGGIAQMRPLNNGIEIPKGAYVEMKPGGVHVMLMGVNQPLAEGQKIPFTLTFAKHPPLTIEATVMKSSAGAEAGHQH